MRAIPRLLGLTAASALAVILLVPSAVLAATGTSSVTVSPVHGQAGASFTATYTRSPCHTPGSTVDFYWNDYPPNGGKFLGSAIMDATCTARLSTVSPAATKPGAYPVYGFISSAGTPVGGTLASAAFTIDALPASAPPSSSPTTSAKPSTTSRSAPAASAGGPSLSLTPVWLLLGALFAIPALVVVAWRHWSRSGNEKADRKAA